MVQIADLKKLKLSLGCRYLMNFTIAFSPFHSSTLAKFKEVAVGTEIWISRQVLREYGVVMSRQGFVCGKAALTRGRCYEH